jgi:hypothetical protein
MLVAISTQLKAVGLFSRIIGFDCIFKLEAFDCNFDY